MEKIKENKVIIIIALVIILVLALVFLILKKDNKENVESVAMTENVDIVKEEETIKDIFVDIKGEVKNPGVYKMAEGSIVNDLIKKAILTKSADTSSLNLSKILTNEMVIIVYSKDEIKNYLNTKEQEKAMIEYCNKENKSLINQGCIDDEKSEEINNTKISINTATKEELMKLNGIGEAKAIDIIEYRKENGLFKSIEDIMNVSGIGEAMFAKIKDYIII